jgi:undecaprenyl-diphosphatase
MLHTGTMGAVIGYFWNSWRVRYFASAAGCKNIAAQVIVATAMTAVVGFALLLLIERVMLKGSPHAEVETLFGNAWLIATGLATVGALIIVAGRRAATASANPIAARQSAWIGTIQGLCLPFRGFSRSGATISTALLLVVEQRKAEEFSFALAVVLTPPVIAREAWRLLKSPDGVHVVAHDWLALLGPGLLGMLASFGAGWLALRWLSRWLERGHWRLFGYYCLFAAGAVLLLVR